MTRRLVWNYTTLHISEESPGWGEVNPEDRVA
jgi:hypothetical protein